MRRFLFVALMLAATISAFAHGNDQERKREKFNPQKFEMRLEQYVVKEACITEAEAVKFLPVFREMRQKQIETINEARKARVKKPATEEEWEEVLKAHDNKEIQLKKILQTYHNRMLKVIPASKIIKMIKAEERFHREIFAKMNQNRQPRNSDKQNPHRGQRPRK